MANPHRPPSHAAIPAVPQDADPCTQDHRIAALEKRADDQSSRLRGISEDLHQGELVFIAIQKDLAQIQANQAMLMTKIESIQSTNYWGKAAESLIFWGVPTLVISVIWLIVQAGQVQIRPPVINIPPASHGVAP